MYMWYKQINSGELKRGQAEAGAIVRSCNFERNQKFKIYIHIYIPDH